jgi:ABC-2 type transport system ATP-binding protein
MDTSPPQGKTRDVADTLGAADQLLEVRALNRRFGRHEVVRRLDFTLRRGERLALRGPNGAGKSTVLRCIAGTVSPSAGSALVRGHPAGSHAARRLIGVSFSQERSFYLRLTGRRNLTFFASLRGLDPRAAALEVARLEEELELGEILAERADRCSTGMILQMSFARALLGDPQLLVLDEPTRSLDAAAAKRLWAAVERRPETGLVIATHRDDDVAHCDASIELPS